MLKIVRAGQTYMAKLSIDQKETVARMGFTWDEDLKVWKGSDRAAYRLLEFVDDKDKAELLRTFNIGRPFCSDIRYPSGRGFTPFFHQIEGARWVLSRRASYIGYEAGLGKTLIASLCLNTAPGPAVIVCPSFLKLNWEDELEKGLIDYHYVQILKKESDHFDPKADIYVIPDSLLHVHAFRSRLFALNRTFRYLFIDEAHRYKSADAKRTQSLLGKQSVKLGKGKTAQYVKWTGLHKMADHVCALSGTPMPNGRPMELYPLISRHAPHAVNFFDPHRFGVRYCGGFESDWGWDYTGATNLEELHHVLSRNYMIVRRKRDCLDMPEKLPPKILFIDDDRGVHAQDEMRLLKTFKITQLIAMEAARSDAFRQRVEDALEDNPDMGGFGFISELRKMTGVSKINASVKVIKELLEDRDKIVVFVWHTEVADRLEEALNSYGVVKITGKVNVDKRHALVKKFQTDSKVRVAVLNIQAGGVGITLTKSSLVVFVERSWRPDDNSQAFDRIDRIGQEEAVQEISLIVRNSLDHLIMNAHINKTENVNAAIRPA